VTDLWEARENQFTLIFSGFEMKASKIIEMKHLLKLVNRNIFPEYSKLIHRFDQRHYEIVALFVPLILLYE
jgi:hypothetical protein